ncbi:hypothetical protein TNCV_106211 [Trichonephila clavipes]|nr:hypothetical protein TNCV_106211 [Trichonephila clavipes]
MPHTIAGDTTQKEKGWEAKGKKKEKMNSISDLFRAHEQNGKTQNGKSRKRKESTEKKNPEPPTSHSRKSIVCMIRKRHLFRRRVERWQEVTEEHCIRNWYWARTRDKASHGPIPIPLGYRSHEVFCRSYGNQQLPSESPLRPENCIVSVRSVATGTDKFRYFQNKIKQSIIKPIFVEEILILYDKDIDKVELPMDKASSHTSKSTAAYLAKKDSEDEMHVKSSDSQWIFRVLRKRHPSTLSGLRKTDQEKRSTIDKIVLRKRLLP